MSSVQIPSRDQIILYIMGLIGGISLITIVLNDDAHYTRFWSSLLHNGTYFTIISMMAIFFVAISITAYAGWNVGFKRVWEAMSQFMYVGFAIMFFIVIGLYLGWHHLYHWADAESVANDTILQGKASFLNKNVYAIVGLGILATWIFFSKKLRRLSFQEDDHGNESFEHHKKMKFWAAIFLPIVGFSSAVAIWLWLMSVDPHWYSTLYAWYTGASCFVSMIALTILLLIYLKSRGYYHNVNQEHFHDLGKFMFAFTVFWTYLWFSQYMLIWYGNNGEETVYFKTRLDQYPVLFYGNLVLNFVLPFLILMRNDNKRKYGTLITVSIIVFFGHWIDSFQMLKPGILHTSHEIGHAEASPKDHGTIGLESTGHSKTDAAHSAHKADGPESGHGSTGAHHEVEAHHGPGIGYSIPGLADIGLLIGFVALYFATTMHFLSKAPLVPRNDPYLQESLHHHV